MMPDFEDVPNPPALVVPHNRESEEGLLGSILIFPDAYLPVATFLQVGDF